MPARKLTDEQEAAVVHDWQEWNRTKVGIVDDIWRKHGVSKETGYNILRRQGAMPQRGELGPVPQEVVRMALDAMRSTIEDLRAQIRELMVENERLRRRK